MLTKRAYTLEEVILFLEAMEMLHMIYKVEKYPAYYDKKEDRTYYNVWIIEYEQGEPLLQEESAIEYED